MVAEFDERSGAIKRLHAMRDGMSRATCHVDEPGEHDRPRPAEALP